MTVELGGFVVLALILTILALTLVVWLRQDMHRMDERLERRLAVAERDRAKSDIAGRAAAE